MKTNISNKLFKVTFGLFITLFSVNSIFQSVFFEDFYLSKKTEDLVSEVNTFRVLYSYQIDNDRALTSALNSYESNNFSKIAIISNTGGLHLASGSFENLADTKSLTDFCAELLNDKELIERVLLNDSVEYTMFLDKSTGFQNIGVIAPMSLSYKNDSIIFSVSSIQPIEEAGNIIRLFSTYFLIGILIISLLLSNIYAKLITKPLITINNTARKMSNFEFGARCEVTSNDELGNLANTLNFLSSNLENALYDLKDKNLKLENQIKKERSLETMRKDFVASISHDLKTPIGIISGYAEGIKDGIVSGEDSMIYLDTIIDEAAKMDKLLNSMLELSKLESSVVNLALEEFNIIRLLKNTAKRLELELENKSICVNFITSIEFGYVIGDSLKIEQVVQNLITNAIKYSPNNSEIIIKVDDLDENYKITVENTNVTIPESELKNIYAKFYKLDKSGDRTKNSFGLGLSIVQRILDLHSSEYYLSNSENSVLFTFTLKKAKFEDDEF